MRNVRLICGWMAVAPAVLAASLGFAGEGVIQPTGCNCNRGGGLMPLTPMPMPNYMPPAMSGAPQLLPAPQIMSPEPPSAYPPPGTLGRSYELPTRLVPAEKHPRIGMLDIRVAAEDVFVSHTNEFREEDDIKGFQDENDPTLWHFETKPLLPGIPHVYKVEAMNGGKATDVRYVRLLRGRIIDLTF